MTWSTVIGAVGLVLGGGVLVHLLDRWRYRRKPALDVAALATEVAATTMKHAQAEIDRTWTAAEQRRRYAEERAAGWEGEVVRLRTEVAELRQRIDQYDRAERRHGEENAVLRNELAAALATTHAQDKEISSLRALTEHAQVQLGSTGTGQAS